MKEMDLGMAGMNISFLVRNGHETIFSHPLKKIPFEVLDMRQLLSFADTP